MNMKKLITVVTSGVLSISLLAGCSSESGQSEDKVIKIGISQLVSHPALDKAQEGFVAALKDKGYEDGKNIELDIQNAQGDTPTAQQIASKFVSDKKDMIFAIATPTAQAAYNATKDIPILITAVTDPIEAGLVSDMDKPDTNVTGTSDYLSVETNAKLINKLVPGAKKVGVMYCTSEANSTVQVKELKAYAKENNLEVVEKGVTNSSEINAAVSSLVGKVDVLFVPTDNLIVSSVPIISKVANENNLPVIASEEGAVSTGALACNGIDYYKLGYQTGLQAVKVIDGTETKDIPLETLKETTLVINEDTLKALGMEKPSDNNINYVKTEATESEE